MFSCGGAFPGALDKRKAAGKRASSRPDNFPLGAAVYLLSKLFWRGREQRWFCRGIRTGSVSPEPSFPGGKASFPSGERGCGVCGVGATKGPLGGAQRLGMAHLSARSRPRLPAPVLGCPPPLEALELFLEGLHLAVNGFDREEPRQPADGRVRRGIREKGVVAGKLVRGKGQEEEEKEEGEEVEDGGGRGQRRGKEGRLHAVGLGSSRAIGIWCFCGANGGAVGAGGSGKEPGLAFIRGAGCLQAQRLWASGGPGRLGLSGPPRPLCQPQPHDFSLALESRVFLTSSFGKTAMIHFAFRAGPDGSRRW